jgi:hypothetical protein
MWVHCSGDGERERCGYIAQGKMRGRDVGGGCEILL